MTYAIELFEEFVLSVFAGQVMTKPIPNPSPSTCQEVSSIRICSLFSLFWIDIHHLIQQVDDNMREFVEWLDDYLSKINENVHTFFRESI